ncbi:MAG: riboflavin synthase [bacterium]|nr:riboflavin synthase [bacterium]
MFTGLIEEVGQLEALRGIGPNQKELTLRCRLIQSDLKLGDSVAIDGVCLTVVRFDDQSAAFELSSETLDKSLFAAKRSGARLNLERALRMGDRLGGHMVQGHVDGIGRCELVEKQGNFYRLAFSFDGALEKYFIPKGSVAINGISLTLSKLDSQQLEVAIIPHTYLETNLSELSPGDLVHLETDLIGRYVERMLSFGAQNQPESKLNESFLKDHGFF